MDWSALLPPKNIFSHIKLYKYTKLVLLFPLLRVKETDWDQRHQSGILSPFKNMFCVDRDEMIDMTRAWDKEKSLSSRRESKPWPPEHGAGVVSTE